MPLTLGLFGLISVGLRLPFLSVPLITDEGGYAYIAYWMGRGLALYRDLWFDRPQGIFLVYAAILNAFGDSTEAIRLAAALYNGGTTVLLGLLGIRLFGRLAGLGAAAIFAVASASPAIEGFTANGELFMNLPVVLSLLLAAQRRLVPAGVALALAMAIKPTALPAAAPALLALLVTDAAWQTGARDRSGALARLAGGFLLGLAPFAGHGLATGAQTYWYAVVGFRVQAHSAFSVGSPLIGELWRTAPTVVAALLPVWLLAFYGLAGRGGRGGRGAAVAVAFAVGSLAGAAAGGYWYWHYYAGLVPPLALLAGAGAARLLEAPWGAASLAVALPSLGVALFFNARLVGDTPAATSWRIYRRPAYVVSREIATYVAARTSAQDTIYAAFAQADLYFLSHRRSAGNHLYWTEINRVPGALDVVLAALDDPLRRPKYVIQIDRELETAGQAVPFWTRVDRLYAPETEIGGFVLYRLRDQPPS
ncbi:MAG: glycosyltransferase family 39 protein [Chloroflexota bacterium]|nr:glycosyltransferase family 39 protein [Chloroflexota bacterium]